MILTALMMAQAFAGAEPPAEAVHDLVLSKMPKSAIVDLWSMKSAADDPGTVCGQVWVNRRFTPIKFIARLEDGSAWFEHTPEDYANYYGEGYRDDGKVVIGHRPELEHAWRSCEATGASMPND